MTCAWFQAANQLSRRGVFVQVHVKSFRYEFNGVEMNRSVHFPENGEDRLR